MGSVTAVRVAAPTLLDVIPSFHRHLPQAARARPGRGLRLVERRVQYVPEPYESFTIRASPLNAARTSAEKSSGSSQAAKWPPLSTSLKYMRLG